MYKLLIVDDEKITRDSLKEYIPWSELGIDIVETARNGVAALEIVKQLKPDILLCDVRMPIMDGITLATEVRSLYPDCKIIFLSGYSDKEYLKSAIKLKAVSYIEKPIDMQEINAVIRESVSLCNEERGKNSVNLIENTISLHQNLIHDLIKGKSDIKALKNKYHDFFSISSGLEVYTVLSIIFNPEYGTDPREMYSLEQHTLHDLYTVELSHSIAFAAGFARNGNVAVLIGRKSSSNDQILEETIENIRKLLLANSHEAYSVSIGVSNSFTSICGMPDAYLEATSIAKMQFYLGVNKIIYRKDFVSSNNPFAENITATFKNLLKKGSTAEASALVKNLTENLRSSMQNDIDHVKNIYFTLLLTVFDVAGKNEASIQTGDNDNKYLWQEIDNINTLSELSEYILSYLEASFRSNDEKKIANKKIQEIKKYIEDHYSDRNLSLQSVAEHVYLSNAYLCTFFKKATGKTINEYITEVRIEKAKDLIADYRIKLYDVATNVGFLDANYFSTIFKKATGLTPSEFRERHHI